MPARSLPLRAAPPAPRAPGRPLILGHRGASADAPENTLAAFRLALEQGADGVELDVWRCGSGEVVVAHDLDCRRVAGSPLRVTEASLHELRALDVGAYRGDRFRGERIPLLVEVLEGLPNAIVNIELKAHRFGDPRLALRVARLVAEVQAEERVIVSSFRAGLVGVVRSIAPHIPTGLLFESGQPAPLRSLWAAPLLAPSALHPQLSLASDEAIDRWQQRGYAVNVWTVDLPDEVARLSAAGVAAIISNKPASAREAVRKATGK
jgi:glycerophosphoryl diester phosphodiesterase